MRERGESAGDESGWGDSSGDTEARKRTGTVGRYIGMLGEGGKLALHSRTEKEADASACESTLRASVFEIHALTCSIIRLLPLKVVAVFAPSHDAHWPSAHTELRTHPALHRTCC